MNRLLRGVAKATKTGQLFVIGLLVMLVIFVVVQLAELLGAI